jgi:hypothetical protein
MTPSSPTSIQLKDLDAAKQGLAAHVAASLKLAWPESETVASDVEPEPRSSASTGMIDGLSVGSYPLPSMTEGWCMMMSVPGRGGKPPTLATGGEMPRACPRADRRASIQFGFPTTPFMRVRRRSRGRHIARRDPVLSHQPPHVCGYTIMPARESSHMTRR